MRIEEFFCNLFGGHVWQIHDNIGLRQCARCGKTDEDYAENRKLW